MKTNEQINKARNGVFNNLQKLENYNFKTDKKRNSILGIKPLGRYMIMVENIDNIDKFIEIADKNAELLGVIYYYKIWKKYVWEQNNEIVMSDRCLLDISEFITKLNKEKLLIKGDGKWKQ